MFRRGGMAFLVALLLVTGGRGYAQRVSAGQQFRDAHAAFLTAEKAYESGALTASLSLFQESLDAS